MHTRKDCNLDRVETGVPESRWKEEDRAEKKQDLAKGSDPAGAVTGDRERAWRRSRHRGSCADTSSRCIKGVRRSHRDGVSLARTYNDLRPATRGWVAHDPPRMMLCFSSKKSATDEMQVNGMFQCSHEFPGTWLTSVRRIQGHRLKAIPLPEGRTGPLPNAAHLTLPT